MNSIQGTFSTALPSIYLNNNPASGDHTEAMSYAGQAVADLTSHNGENCAHQQGKEACDQWISVRDKQLKVKQDLDCEIKAMSKAFSKETGDGRNALPVVQKHLPLLRQSLDALALSNRLDAPREEVIKNKLIELLTVGSAPEAPGRVISDAYKLANADDATNSASLRNKASLEQTAPLAIEMPQPFAAAAGSQNLGEIWKQLADMISGSNKANVDNFANALDRYTSLYQDLTNIISNLGIWVNAKGENNMTVNFSEIKKALQALLDKYSPPGEEQTIAGPFANKADAIALCEKLGLDPDKCIYASFGTFRLIPDLSQAKSMLESLPGSTAEFELSIAAYNSWKAGFDAQTNRIEDALQARGQKYSNEFGRFENFHKAISSIIQAMADMLAKYLQF